MIDSVPAARGRPAGGRARYARAGFTLIEMLVALAVFALVAMALLNLSGESTRSAVRVEARTLGGLVAENVAADAMIAPSLPVGEVSGETQMAGRVWRWRRVVTGTEVAGIPLAVAVSLKMNLPFVAVRKQKKEFLNQVFIDGAYQKGQKAVLLDDAIGWGNTKKLMVQNAKRSSLIIKDIICLYDSYTHEPRKRKWFFQHQIKIKALASREEIFNYLNQVDLISDEIAEINRFYTANPAGWHQVPKQWQKFLAWKKNYLKTKKI